MSTARNRKAVKPQPPRVTGTKTVALRMPLDLLEQALQVADAEDRTLTSLIVHALRKHVRQEREAA